MNARTAPPWSSPRLAVVRQVVSPPAAPASGLTPRVEQLLQERAFLLRTAEQHRRDVDALSPEELTAYEDAVSGTGAPRP